MQTTGPYLVELPAGERVEVRAGDWLITRGQTIVDWARADALDRTYEMILDGELRLPRVVVQRLERTTGIGTGRDPYALVEAVERLAAIAIGTIHVEFTPGQLDEIAHRARKRGHTVQQELEAAVDRVKDEIFHRG